MTLVSLEQLYFLRKGRKGLKFREEYQTQVDELQAEGLISIRRTLVGLRYKLTTSGKKKLRQARNSANKLQRYIAQGYCDHLSYAMFDTLHSLGKLEQYIEGQRRIYQLAFFSHFWQRWFLSYRFVYNILAIIKAGRGISLEYPLSSLS